MSGTMKPAGCRRVFLVAALLATLGASALPAAALSVREYGEFARSAASGNSGTQDALNVFATALLNAAAAFNGSAAQLGATPEFCVPATASPAQLLQAIKAELTLREAQWLDRQDGDVGLLALAAMKWRWPCRQGASVR